MQQSSNPLAWICVLQWQENTFWIAKLDSSEFYCAIRDELVVYRVATSSVKFVHAFNWYLREPGRN